MTTTPTAPGTATTGTTPNGPTTAAGSAGGFHEPDLEAVADRVLSDGTTFLEYLGVALGLELGLYRTLAEHGPATPSALADRAGVDHRYTREWLEQQTVAGWVRCQDTSRGQEERVFELPAAVATVLLDPDGGAHLGPLVQMCRGVAEVFHRLPEAYRTGAGVSYADYGPHIRHGIGGLNGPTVEAGIAGWLADGLPDVHARLTGGAARVLDLGCGTGRSSVALALAHPRVSVRGVDSDAASVADARRAAATAGVADRVTFTRGNAADVDAADGRYDLVLVVEALHDMGDPVGVLRAARQVLTDGGAVYVADEKVADEFTADADVVERLQYGFSVLHCLPATVAEGAGTYHGTVLRRPTVVDWADRAGLTVRDLGVEDPFWRHYRMDPRTDA